MHLQQNWTCQDRETEANLLLTEFLSALQRMLKWKNERVEATEITCIAFQMSYRSCTDVVRLPDGRCTGI